MRASSAVPVQTVAAIEEASAWRRSQIDQRGIADLAPRSQSAGNEQDVIGLGVAKRDIGNRSRPLFAGDRAGALGDRLDAIVVGQHAKHLERAEYVEQLKLPGTAARRSSSRFRSAKHALEDRVDVLQVIAEVEHGLELGRLQLARHVLVGLEQGEEVACPRSTTCMALRCTMA